VDSVPPSSEQKDRPLTFVAAALWTLLVLLADAFVVGMTEAGREGAYLDIVSRTGCEALAYSIVFFGILRVHEPETSIRHVLALRRPSIVALFLAIAVGVALSLPAEWIDQILDARFPRSPQDQENLDRLFSVTTVGKRVGLITAVVVVQPIFDELFFRGALFTPLRRTRSAESVVLATAAFEALRSGTPRSISILLVTSLVFAWVRAATGSIFPSIVARVSYMAVAAIPIVVGRELPKPTKAWLAGSAALALFELFGLKLLSRRDARGRVARVGGGD
jgi:membrane protease YdiL (CAAX protease family)